MPLSLRLDPAERKTTAERVERLLRDEILRERFAPGDKLPAERDLAASLGVTRVTLRSALARLSASGLVSTVQGDGHRVRDVRRHGGLARLPDMAAAFRNDATRVVRLVSDLLALRSVVIAEAAAICSQLDDDARAGLRTALSAMELAIDDHEAFVQADLAFGRTLVRLTGNVAFELTFNTMTSLAESEPELMKLLYADRELLLEAARSLLVLLSARDAELARTTVRAALTALDEPRLRAIASTVATSTSTPKTDAPKNPKGTTT